MQIPQIHPHHYSTMFWVFITYVIVSNAVNAMPEPGNLSSAGYKWFFTFSHGVLMQVGRFANRYMNGDQQVAQLDQQVKAQKQGA